MRSRGRHETEMSAAPARELFQVLQLRPLESRARRSTSAVRKYMYCQIDTTVSAAPHRLTSSEKLFISYCTSPCMFLWNSKCYLARKRMALLVKPISQQHHTINSSPTMKRRRTLSPDSTIIFLLCRRYLMHKVLDTLASTIRTKLSIKTRPLSIQCFHSVHGYVEGVHCIHDCE